MTDSVEKLRALFLSLTGCTDTATRDIICTPCEGGYGTVEMWVIAVRGTPARGIICAGQNEYSGMDDVFFIYQGRSRRLGEAQCKTVRNFERHYLSVAAHPHIDTVHTVLLDGTSVKSGNARIMGKKT